MMVEVDHEAVRMLHTRGREAWPQIDLDLATFAAAAAAVVSTASLDVIRAGDLYLAIACAARIEPAIAAFDEHYLSGLVSALVRRGHAAAAAADAVQAARMRFLVGKAGRAPRISQYDGRSSLATWIRIAVVRIAINAHHKYSRETGDEIDLVAAERSPELEVLCRQFGSVFKAAFRCTFEALSPRQRTLLRFQVIDRLGIDRIAAIYGVHRATAARWVAHAREALVEGVRRMLQGRLCVDTDELDSLLGLLCSKFELSLQLLQTPT